MSDELLHELHISCLMCLIAQRTPSSQTVYPRGTVSVEAKDTVQPQQEVDMQGRGSRDLRGKLLLQLGCTGHPLSAGFEPLLASM